MAVLNLRQKRLKSLTFESTHWYLSYILMMILVVPKEIELYININNTYSWENIFTLQRALKVVYIKLSAIIKYSSKR